MCRRVFTGFGTLLALLSRPLLQRSSNIVQFLLDLDKSRNLEKFRISLWHWKIGIGWIVEGSKCPSGREIPLFATVYNRRHIANDLSVSRDVILVKGITTGDHFHVALLPWSGWRARSGPSSRPPTPARCTFRTAISRTLLPGRGSCVCRCQGSQVGWDRWSCQPLLPRPHARGSLDAAGPAWPFDGARPHPKATLIPERKNALCPGPFGLRTEWLFASASRPRKSAGHGCLLKASGPDPVAVPSRLGSGVRPRAPGPWVTYARSLYRRHPDASAPKDLLLGTGAGPGLSFFDVKAKNRRFKQLHEMLNRKDEDESCQFCHESIYKCIDICIYT